MTVKDLIEFLLQQPQDIQVAYYRYSEQCLMDKDKIEVFVGCKAREDGWIENIRPDKPSQQYLMFPGS